ncbi:FAD-dependent oxidoreductase [bacterium]|nr:FAD-dependent oxidoreductase [bacterium]
MNKTDILVIGSSAAGLVAALTAKSSNPDKNVTVIRMEEKTLVPCGIPYIFGSIKSSNNNIMPSDKMFASAGVNLVIGKVVAIDRDAKVCKLENGDEYSYEKLVLGTGSTPVRPKWLKGTNLENVFTVPKDKNYLDAMQEKLKDCQKVVIIGGGFIGVELSDELKKAGKEVILVEKLPHILGLAFDEDVALRAEELLKSRGVIVNGGIGVSELTGDTKVNGVLLENGDKIAADAVVLSIGYAPNTQLAKDAGLAINERGFIKVDEYMRTEDSSVFAIGDCAEKKDFVTRKTNSVMLASTACAEARIAAMNLYKLSLVKTFSGTISIFATALGDTGFGVAGLTETRAIEEGFDIIVGTFEGMDRHPGCLPGMHKQMVKLIFGRESGVLLGGEVYGGLATGELTNTLGLMIQGRMGLNAILTAQIGTHPLLTASPAGYPLLKAAEVAAKQK